MKKIATLVAGAAVAAIAFTSPAQAEFVLADNVFADLGATGFGNAPRLLSLQNNPFENGAVVSVGGTQTFLNNITIGPAPGFTVTGTPCTTNGTSTLPISRASFSGSGMDNANARGVCICRNCSGLKLPSAGCGVAL